MSWVRPASSGAPLAEGTLALPLLITELDLPKSPFDSFHPRFGDLGGPSLTSEGCRCSGAACFVLAMELEVSGKGESRLVGAIEAILTLCAIWSLQGRTSLHEQGNRKEGDFSMSAVKLFNGGMSQSAICVQMRCPH